MGNHGNSPTEICFWGERRGTITNNMIFGLRWGGWWMGICWDWQSWTALSWKGAQSWSTSILILMGKSPFLMGITIFNREITFFWWANMFSVFTLDMKWWCQLIYIRNAFAMDGSTQQKNDLPQEKYGSSISFQKALRSDCSDLPVMRKIGPWWSQRKAWGSTNEVVTPNITQ